MTGRRAAGEPEVQRPAQGISIGVDLAAAPVNTAAVELAWEGDRATIVDVWGEGRERVEDAMLISLFDRSDAKIGVDCPFGWPQEFVELVGDQGSGEPGGSEVREASFETPDERQRLVYRATDLDVIEVTKRHGSSADPARPAVRPLSVSSDRIAHVALRFAGLRSRLSVTSSSPRDGSGALVEVYPAAALALWNAPSYRRYKGAGSEAQRAKIVAALCAGVPDIMSSCANIDEHRSALIASDHVLDAFICALVARDADLRGVQVPSAHRDAARQEGWIHLPLRTT